MHIERIFDKDLAQATWLIGCQASGEALIIDPERDICRYLNASNEAGLRIIAIAETHIHADFLSGAAELAAETNATCYLSACGGPDWLYQWPKTSDAKVQFVQDGDTFSIGNITITVVHSPGHTPEHISFLVRDSDKSEPLGYATGDFVFVGDLGRPDLLETAAGMTGVMDSSAKQLHESCLRFMEMDEHIQVWPAHSAGSSCGKALGAVPQSTVGYEIRTSPPLQFVGDEEKFVQYILTGQPEPPLYFARMKRMNRDGIPLLGGLPTPTRIEDPTELTSRALSCTVIDTRPWDEVKCGHLPNSIWSKADGDFHQFAGSFVSDQDDIIFIVNEDTLDRAVRNAIRIGLDKIVAWADPTVLAQVKNLAVIPEVQPSELDDLAFSNILDVRRMTEFTEGSIGGAMNIAHTRLLDRLDEINKDAPWLVHCHAGMRSAAACMALRREGYDVTNLAGGYKRWKSLQVSHVESR